MIWKHVWSGNVMKKLICKQSVYWHKTAFQIKVGLVRHLVIHSHIEMRHPDNWPVYICIYTVVRMFHFNVWMNYTKCPKVLRVSKCQIFDTEQISQTKITKLGGGGTVHWKQGYRGQFHILHWMLLLFYSCQEI